MVWQIKFPGTDENKKGLTEKPGLAFYKCAGIIL
jgi:hypothetical protein